MGQYKCKNFMGKSNKKNVNENKNADQLLYTLLQFYASFFPGFYLLELTLKNRIYHELKDKLGNDWFNRKLADAQNDPLFAQEKEYIMRRKSSGFEVTDEGLKVESGLGFWVEFFNRRLYKETKGIPIAIFKKLPKEKKRKDIYTRLERIRQLRNQLVHSRIPPVANAAQSRHLERMLETAKDLGEIFKWFGNIPKFVINRKEIATKAKAIKKLMKISS